MFIIFKKMADIHDNITLVDDIKLVYKLETDEQEDVFVSVLPDEVLEESAKDTNTEQGNFNPNDYYSKLIWKILFEKAIKKYQQARTQLMKKC